VHDLTRGHVEVDAGEGGETAENRDRGAEVDDRALRRGIIHLK
jgi:hypothetical protein